MRLFEPESTSSNSPEKLESIIEKSLAMESEKSVETEEISSMGFIPVLQNKRFLILWLGQVFSQLADKIYLVLMISLIASYFQKSSESISGWVSAVMIASTIPAVLFGSLAGVYVDRWPKKTVLIFSNLWRGFLVLSLPLLLWLSHNYYSFAKLPLGFLLLLIVTFLLSTLTQFFAPAEQATIPLIVKRRHLLPANSLYTTTMMASLIIGFAVGEPLLKISDTLVKKIDLSWNFGQELVVGGAYIIASILLSLIKTEEKIQNRLKEQPHVFQDIRDGIIYLSKNHRVRNALIQLVILFSIFAALTVLAVPLAKTMELKPEQFGFFLAAAGVGMGFGAAMLGSWGQLFSLLQLSLVGSIGVAISLLALSLLNLNLVLALTIIALLGGFAALVGVPMQTTIQAETPAQMRGKVFGLQNNAVNIALSLPLALAGIAETFFGLKTVFFALALLAMVGAVLSWYLFRQSKVKLGKPD